MILYWFGEQFNVPRDFVLSVRSDERFKTFRWLVYNGYLSESLVDKAIRDYLKGGEKRESI